MKKSDRRKIERKIEDLLFGLDHLFGIQAYEKNIAYEKDYEDGEEIALASADISHKYCRIQITIYDTFFEQSPKIQFNTIVHELVHAITDGSRSAMFSLLSGNLVTESAIRDINERETSQIETIIVSMIKTKKYYESLYADFIGGRS